MARCQATLLILLSSSNSAGLRYPCSLVPSFAGTVREQVNRVAVRVVDPRVALSPERVPRGQMAVVAGCDVAGIEAADGVDAVPNELKPARQGGLDVWLCVGLGRDSEAELPVEGQRPCHVGDYDADDTELWGGHRVLLSGGMLKGGRRVGSVVLTSGAGKTHRPRAYCPVSGGVVGLPPGAWCRPLLFPPSSSLLPRP